ncbi:hypothetical protein MKX01_026161 [Papaver californicum]|nr:hypothetical protein MKX01_026161 [Papaver californicum]
MAIVPSPNNNNRCKACGVDHSAFAIYRGKRNYDDEQPLNKNSPNLEDFHRAIDDPAPYIVVVHGPPNVRTPPIYP